MVWTGGWRRPVIGAGVLALHVLLVAVLLRAGISTPVLPTEQETVLALTPLVPPPPKPDKKKPRAPNAAPRATATPRYFTLPPVSIPPSNASQGLGASLGCGASSYDTLNAEQRAACGHGPWQFDRQAHETASLTIPPGPHQITPAEIAEHMRRTADPCAADKAAHLPFCIYRIIYGDKLP